MISSSKALHDAGLFLDLNRAEPNNNEDPKVRVRSEYNLDGYWETEEAVAINDQISRGPAGRGTGSRTRSRPIRKIPASS